MGILPFNLRFILAQIWGIGVHLQYRFIVLINLIEFTYIFIGQILAEKYSEIWGAKTSIVFQLIFMGINLY